MDERAIAEIAAWAVLAVNARRGRVRRLALVAGRSRATRSGRCCGPGRCVAFAQAAVAGGLFAAGYDPRDDLYWLYALLPVAIGLIAEQLRVASAEQVLEHRELPDAQAVGALPEAEQRSVVLAIVRREIGVMALAALVVAFLALRAALIA